MENKGNSTISKKKPFDPDVYNTKDTTPELCLYYNLALNRINELLTVYEGKPVYIEKEKIEKETILLSDETYINLKAYLWKEHLADNYTILKDEEREMINLILQKLVDVRNFHSHYYHDSKALLFDEEIKNIIIEKFDLARNSIVYQHPNFLKYLNVLEEDKKEFKTKDYQGNDIIKEDKHEHFNYFDNNGFLKEEGKNFFLSFFLLKGEMSKFLKKRNRCKRDNGEKYQVKTMLLTYYCHRDGSNRYFTKNKESFNTGNEPQRRQFNTILNYLKSKPVADSLYLPPTKEISLYSKEEIADRKEANISNTEQQETEYIRRKSKFTELAIRYIMDRKLLGHNQEQIIKWKSKTFSLINPHEESNKGIEEEDRKKYFQNDIEWNSEFKFNCFPVVKNNHVYFRINNTPNQYMINERELKNWLYFLLFPPKHTLDNTIEKIEQYGTQYLEAMQELFDKNTITFINYPLVFGKDGMDRKILSDAHNKILDNQKFNIEDYRENISERLETTINFLKEQLTKKNTFTRNQKNRTILKALNWFLPIDAKLSSTDINSLSIHNYIKGDNKVKSKTKEIVFEPVKVKIEKIENVYKDVVDNLRKAESLDSLFDFMLNKKIEEIKKEQTKLSNMSEEQLHRLASKVRVRMHGINNDNRDKDKNRQVQLKETLKNQPILIPNGFFKRCFSPEKKEQISTLINRNAQFKSLLITDNYSLKNQAEYIHASTAPKDIPVELLNIVEEKHDDLFKVYSKREDQPFTEFIALFKPFLEKNYDDKLIRKAINLRRTLQEVQVQDILLAQILFEYHNLELPLDKREAKHQNIATLYVNEYKLKIGNKEINLPYKQLDDLSTFWNKKKIEALLNNSKYWNETILKELDEKGMNTDQQKLAYVMNSIYNDSFHYISAVLEIEKKGFTENKTKKSELIQASKSLKSNYYGLDRIEFEVLLKKIIPENYKKFVDLRNAAFHTDIPDDNVKYEDLKDELKKKAGIVDKPKDYRKTKFKRR